MKSPVDVTTGRIVGYDEKRGELLIRAPYTDWPTMTRREYKQVRCQLVDSRKHSDKQRRSVYAMIGEIAAYMGEYPADAKEFLKLQFMADEIESTTDAIFSMRDAPMSLVAAFQSYLARFIVRHDIPTKKPMLEYVDDIRDYVYACIIHKKCVICGKRADLHHIDRVGMGRDREEIIHEGMEAISLCREHHELIHRKGEKEVFELYHLDGGIVLDKTLCKIYGLKTGGKNHAQ